MLCDQGLMRALHVDHPDGAIPDERDAAPVGRPLRIGSGLLGCGELFGIAAANRHHEYLASSRSLGRECHAAAVRRQPELARGLDRGGLLDRQPVSSRAARSTVVSVRPRALRRATGTSQLRCPIQLRR